MGCQQKILRDLSLVPFSPFDSRRSPSLWRQPQGRVALVSTFLRGSTLTSACCVGCILSILSSWLPHQQKVIQFFPTGLRCWWCWGPAISSILLRQLFINGGLCNPPSLCSIQQHWFYIGSQVLWKPRCSFAMQRQLLLCLSMIWYQQLFCPVGQQHYLQRLPFLQGTSIKCDLLSVGGVDILSIWKIYTFLLINKTQFSYMCIYFIKTLTKPHNKVIYRRETYLKQDA